MYKKFLPRIQIYSICNIVLKFHKLLLQYSYKTYKTKECSLEDELTEGKIKLLLRKKKTGKRIHRILKLHYCGNADLNKPDDAPVARKPMMHQGVPEFCLISCHAFQK